MPTRSAALVRGNIRRFLLGAESLPAPQGTAARLQELAQDPRSSLDEVVQVVRADPGLSGFVLRSANSALHGGGRKLMSVQQAVMRLGINIVRVHALALALSKQKLPLRCEGFDHNAFWTHALLSAELMAAQAGEDGQLPVDEAFALGLLGSIGKLAFATAAPEEYAEVLYRHAAGGRFLDDLERETFGFDHHELSAVLLADWQLPTAMADVVFWQCAPEDGGFRADSRAHRQCGALLLASQLATALLCPRTPDADTLSAVYLRGALLGLSPDAVRQLARGGLAALPEWLRLAGLPAPRLQVLPEGWPR